MKLAAIYNVWDGEELLQGSVDSILKHVDVIIIVYQSVSNYNESYFPEFDIFLTQNPKVSFVHYQPGLGSAVNHEIRKRNMGLEKAREFYCTHFLHMDCDEYYRDFGKAKQAYIDSKRAGSVVKLHTYFKKPTLRLDIPENYFVPFIHQLGRNTFAGAKHYPFYVDPTRRINQIDVIELPYFMDHYSYVRKDILRKVRNSTARRNIEKSTHLNDYNRDLKAGDYIACYGRKLIEVEDYYGITGMLS